MWFPAMSCPPPRPANMPLKSAIGMYSCLRSHAFLARFAALRNFLASSAGRVRKAAKITNRSLDDFTWLAGGWIITILGRGFEFEPHGLRSSKRSERDILLLFGRFRCCVLLLNDVLLLRRIDGVKLLLKILIFRCQRERKLKWCSGLIW